MRGSKWAYKILEEGQEISSFRTKGSGSKNLKLCLDLMFISDVRKRNPSFIRAGFLERFPAFYSSPLIVLRNREGYRGYIISCPKACSRI